MKLNSLNSIILILAIAFFVYILFRIHQFMISPAPSDYNHLKIGDNAPEFIFSHNTKNNEKKDTKLSDILNQGKGIILYFYPKDNTKYCTKQALSFIAKYNDIKKLNYEVIGISSDSQASHDEFTKKYKIPYPLACDTNYEIHQKYGSCAKIPFWGRKTYRMTFIIDQNGIIKDIIKNIDTKNHASQVIESIKKININKRFDNKL